LLTHYSGWVADRIRRINGTLVGAIFALIGGALQAATQNAAFILGARVVTGIGRGALIAIITVYVSETSTSHGRGKFLGLVFIVSLRHPPLGSKSQLTPS
jgi:MFS family permease